MRIMSNENMVSVHDVVWYMRNCSVMSQDRVGRSLRTSSRRLLCNSAAATGSSEGHTTLHGTVRGVP